ncbi:hypothetical protein PANO111632_13905 [Paracoccus nototheniae]|uniref:hypothetical protein n=1 Tax=Paracoccus nototheniae TaxID=2489002 RepID=UPI001039569A|nr:hypothetical protein [Paracoccus nototheniae]
MVTIYDKAVRNFQSAAGLLMSLQACRTVLSGDAAALLEGRPKAPLYEGYNSLSPRFGICIPTDARAEYTLPESGEGLEFRNSGLTWMTMEGLVETRGACSCYLDADAVFPAPTIADVFLREFVESGGIRDSLHREWQLGTDRAALCQLDLSEASDDVAHRRIIIHLRQPPLRFVLRSLSMTVI